MTYRAGCFYRGCEEFFDFEDVKEAEKWAKYHAIRNFPGHDVEIEEYPDVVFPYVPGRDGPVL